MIDTLGAEQRGSAKELWDKILSTVRTKVSSQLFSIWFESTEGDSILQNTLWIKVPNVFFAEWIEEHYSSIIDEAILCLIGEKLSRKYKYEDKPKQAETTRSSSVAKGASGVYVSDTSHLLSRYTFSTFVVGENNKFANAASLAVARAPGKAYNPLFIHGSVGLGKTHLLVAIGNYVQETFDNLKVYYVQCETILNEMIDAIQTNKTIQFKNRYRRKDVLLIDDVEFLEGKEELQEETFHMFNSLYDAGKQCVFTSDRPPSAFQNLQERLVSRLKSGLICTIKMPPFETRVAILKKKAEKFGIHVPDKVIFFIAEKIDTSIRDLEGALIKLCAISSLTKGELTIETAENILKDINGDALKKEINVEEIQKIVATYYNVSSGALRGKRRMQSIVKPRNVAIYLSREHTSLSLIEVGKYFGGRDHATILHSYNQIKKVIEKDTNTAQEINNILKLITCE